MSQDEKPEKNEKAAPGNSGGRPLFTGFFLSAALAFGFACGAQAGIPLAGGDNSIRRNLVSGGGAVASGAGFSLNYALAETAIATAAGSAFNFNSGLMPLAAQPGTIISLTAVSKATGTLELAWNAPGLDGFLGAVTGGQYRIDTSSQASHVFDPAVFVTEFSTSVTPGEPQAYILTGLEPNTTYYTRVYLADARKVVAERSAPGDESTLANLPVSPVLSGVFRSSVTFAWTLPPGSAEGYQLDGSSTNFGALFPGGVVHSSVTDQGTRLTLAINGLNPDTSYFFRLASLNWQQDVNFGTIIATRTMLGTAPLPVENLASLPDGLARRLMFSWANAGYDDPTGVLVQMSTMPITYGLAAGANYGDGNIFPDGSVVLSSAAGSSQLHEGLALNSTYYYRFSSHNTARAYSVFVATECILDLPPMSPAGLEAFVSPDRSAITMNWSGVSSNLDGSGFRHSGEGMELARYEVYRATGIIRSSWALVASVPVSSQSVTVPVPDPDTAYYYKVAAMDSIGTPGTSMVVDTDRNLYAVAPDQVSRLKIPAGMTGVVLPAGNPSGRPIFFAARERAQDEGGKIMKSVEFRPVQAPDGGELADFRFEKPETDIVLRYDTESGQVVPSSFKGSGISQLSSLASSVRASDARTKLGVYWFNGKEYVKVFGTVNPEEQTITVRSALPGSYQIRSLVRAGGVSFGVKEMSNKVITPNGDGLNDYVVFTLDNPKDSSFSGKIYDLTGALVAEMRPGTQIADTLEWNGKAGGSAVPRGVYVYQIKAEEKTFNGTIVVIR
ncbi:MAG: gliding motility-associated C-terminal domain-containing protein [Elusimicrobiota bacterium]|nr:gliding motility-associated C-terminal domain-containing protein [Elusimicrobiota bacterium]